MTPREETARRFAEAVGWKYDGEAWDERKQFRVGTPNKYGEHPQRFRLPAADAPLHEQLEFVGRVAEALGCGVQLGYDPNRRAAWVAFDERLWGSVAPDLCHAAMLAGIAAKEGSR